MKRIVLLIDGTWDKEGASAASNVAKLDASNHAVSRPIVKAIAEDGTRQLCHYHPGAGTDGDLLKRLLGGAIGLGLKSIVLNVYGFLVDSYEHGDEIYIFGFSRGSYAARALAGLIGASGIQRQRSADAVELAWKHYRINPTVRNGEQPPGSADKLTLQRFEKLKASDAIHPDRTIKCVGVWDTVGSYGIPTGFGLAPLARVFTWLVLGFHDTRFGDHIDVGLHAVSVDERRRPFAPTFWTARKNQPPRGRVEQTWFAGVHCNIGGGYDDSGLSDFALIWMIARVGALTKLEFDTGAIKAVTEPNLDGAILNSSKGWPISEAFPHHRRVLQTHSIQHGAFFDSDNLNDENINERVHWTVPAKRGRPGIIFGNPGLYEPQNVPSQIPIDKIATITDEERALTSQTPPLSSIRL